MKVILKMGKKVVLENIYFIKVMIYLKVNGIMIKEMEKGNLFILMDLFLKVFGKMI